MGKPCCNHLFALLLTLFSIFQAGPGRGQELPGPKPPGREAPGQALSGIIATSGEQIQAGAYDSAILTCRRGLLLCSNRDTDKLKLSLLYNYIGASFLFKGDFDSAVSYFYNAVHYAQSADSGDLQLLRIYNNLSLTFTRTLDKDKALFYLERAEQIARDLKLEALLVSIWLNKGRIYKEQGKLEQSERIFKEALQLNETAEHMEKLTGISARAARLMLLTNLGQLYFTQSKYTAARKVLEEALPLSKDVNPYYRLPVRIALGRVYLQLKEYESAEDHLLKALVIAETAKINDGLAEGHYYLAETYNAKGEMQKAYDHLLKSYYIEDMLRNANRTKDSRLLEVKYRTALKDKELAERKLAVAEKDRLLKAKNSWIMGTSLLLLFLAILLLTGYKNYRHRQGLQQQKMLAIEQDRHIGLLKATADGEERERSRIASNLHDGIGSLISAAKMNFSTLHTLDSEKAVFDKSMKLLNDAAFELRTTAHNLMPQMLLQEGLVVATRDFCERVSNSQSLFIEYQAYGKFASLEKNRELFVYRTIQELVSNIIKHSGAQQALVQLSMAEDLLTVTVEDNGKGYRIDASDNTKGSGLKNLEEKVRMHNGRLTMESAPGKGTQVYMEFDCCKAEINLTL